nr:UDP-glycosyltransferase [uncultured Flavobacterium sp.]
MKKILVVVDSINIEDSSGSKANVALINNLQQAGFEVLVHHYTLKNIRLEDINTFAIPEIKGSVMYFLSRSQRIISRNFKINMAPFLERLFGFSFTFFNDANSIARALKKCTFQPDLVLTLSKGASFRPHYALLRLPELHNKWMAYVHDPYPFHFYPRPYTWVEPSYKFKENFFFEVSKKAKYSAFPSQLLLEWMGSYFPEFIKSGVVIPHQNSKNISQNSGQNNNLPSYFDNSKFNLLHAGNLMGGRSPKGLIDGFLLFLNQNPQASKESKLILLGNASNYAEMIQGYESYNNEIYFYNGNVAFDIVYNLQKNASVNIILESKSEISPFLPGKFPHCVEANKAILSLAPYYSEIRRLLGNDYPYWTEVDQVDKIADIIDEMYQLWKQNPDDLLLNREDLVDYLSKDYLKNIIDGLQNE